MEWQDKGMIIGTKPYQDHFRILEILTQSKGKKAGLIRINPKKNGNPLQVGTVGHFQWKARLLDHLGLLKADITEIAFAKHMLNPRHLHLIQSICGLLSAFLPEHAPHSQLYTHSLSLLHQLSYGTPLKEYVLFEVSLLKELGFALTLDRCAITGATDELLFLSSQSGQALCKATAQHCANDVFPIPAFLQNHETTPSWEDLLNGMQITGHFMEKHLLPPYRKMPASRAHLLSYLQSHAQEKCSAL